MQRIRTINVIVLAVFVILTVIYIALFADDRWQAITMILSNLVGLILGNFLMLGLFRRFDWGESAARSIFVWTLVGGMALTLLMLFVLDDAMDAPQPNLATIVYWTAVGVLIGAAARAGGIRRQLRTEGSRQPG